MLPIRIKACSESDLRMLGNLARNIQRVLPVTQADIDAAAALGKGWVVWKVIEVNNPIDNLRGGTQLVIKQNSITPGQNVRRVLIVSGPGGETVVIGPGPSPLLLPNAIANTLSYVKAFGGTEQSGTPTPDAPVDIVCNNGALKARHQSGLPLGYTLVDGITANGTQYIDTGIKIASTDTVETEFKNSTSTGYGAVYGIYATGESSAFYANQTYYGYDESNDKVNTNVAVDDQWHTVVHDFVNGTLQLDDTTVTFTPFVFANANNNGLFTRFYNGSYGYFFKGSVKSHKITRNGTVIFNAVSVQRDSDSALGMYDFVSDTFFENDGTGDFTAGIAVSDPVEVYANSTVEIIEDTIGNTATAEMLLKVGDYQDVQSIIDGVVTRNVGVMVLDGTEEFNSSTLTNCWTLARSVGLGNFTDRIVCCTHFNHSTTLLPASDRQGYAFIGNSSGFYTIGFGATTRFPTQEQFKQWLADQYAAGTPVIVIYPLAEPTTESVAGQTLQVTDGDNVLEITQASLSGLQLEAEYEKVA